MNRSAITFAALLMNLFLGASSSFAGPAGTTIRETAEVILKKFGKGVAGQTVEELTEATTRVVARYGDDALPLLRKSGHAGFAALEEAGEKAPDIIKLYARKGNEAIWVISQPKKLAIFMKHGDSAADALLKHPGIADTLIGKYRDDAVGALNSVSRQSAQRLSMIADDGVLTATSRSSELLPIIQRYGDAAMNFIWKNKGALTVASALTLFLANPEAYISGAKSLVVDPIVGPIARSVNWTLLIIIVAGVVFAPFIIRSIKKAAVEARSHRSEKDDKTT
jgi:hypothetical protein